MRVKARRGRSGGAQQGAGQKLSFRTACSLGSLRNLIREVDPALANVTISTLADAMASLAEEGALVVGKRDGGKRLPFDQQKRYDEGYISMFFARGEFDLKLTHEGRRRIEEGEREPETQKQERERKPVAVDDSQDRKFARLAIDEARKSVPEGDARPHPFVGAVVVKDGKALATAHRGEAEGNHAEYIVLEKKLGATALVGATVYTTLEPCTTRNHPKIPCADRLIERKVARVVTGMLDPNPNITGRGLRRLRGAISGH